MTDDNAAQQEQPQKREISNYFGFKWDLEALNLLQELALNGLSEQKIADRFNERYRTMRFSPNMIHMARRRYNMVTDAPISESDDIPRYKEPTMPMDNYMVSCDYHAPFYSEAWANRLLAVAKRFKIRKNLIIGDLFDFEFMSHYPPQDGQERASFEQEKNGNTPLIQALDYFDENYLVSGNHERRVGLQTEGRLLARHLVELFGSEIFQKKFKFSDYDKLNVGDNWLMVHPKSYSQVSGSVAIRLAEKYHKHVLNAHGHFTAMRWDRSGQYMGIDIGGLFDSEKIAYKQFKTTTHPDWNPGFGMLYNGHFYLFHLETDWGFWLR